MIIRDNATGRVNNPYLRTLQSVDKTQRESTAREAATPQRDEIGISAEAMMLQKTASSVADGEEVRWAKVDELRQRLAQGDYKIAADRLAGRLLGDE